MKTNLVLFGALFMLLLVACGKDKFTTKPQVNVKTITPGDADRGDIVSMQSRFTDEEGDIDSVYVVLKWYDGDVSTRQFDTLRYSFSSYNLPAEPRDGDIFVKFVNGQIIQGFTIMQGTPVSKDTTASFGIVLVDRAKNRSDYTESDKIRLRK